MIKFLRFVPVQLTLFLILGILVEKFISIPLNISVGLVLVCMLLLGILYVLSLGYKEFYKQLFTVVSLVGAFLMGVTSQTIATETNLQKHYSNSIYFSNEVKHQAVLKIRKELKSSSNYAKYEAIVVRFEKEPSKGKVLLQFKKDSSNTQFAVDDEISVKTTFSAIQNTTNPYGFDYKKYLNNQQIYHQLYLNNQQFLRLRNPTTTVFGISANARNTITESLQKDGFKNDELAVVNALLLGQRNSISVELLENYTEAGAIHILAVSGLHVGIILLLLMYLCKPLHYFKHGKTIASVLVVLALWSYAFLAGLSPSVIRAVTMFTALSIGLHVNKPTNVYNTLVISLFFLLLYNPSYLVDVGFQLSYSAVFSIVWIQPKIYNLITVKWWLPHKIWQVFSVSLAAQIGVLPVSLFYFHQFPALFFVVNIIVIPVLGIILIGGILVMLLSLLNSLPTFLATVYMFVIKAVNGLVSWVAGFDSFVLRNISMSFLFMVTLYFLFVLLLKWTEKRNFSRLLWLLLAVISVQGVLLVEKYTKQTTNQLIVFNKPRGSVIAIQKGDSLFVTAEIKIAEIQSYVNGAEVENVQLGTLQHKMIPFENNRILVVDSLGIYDVKSVKPTIVLLQHSPKINMERLIQTLKPSIIIADGSNYKSYSDYWERTCLKNKTPFYNTMQKGAFILKE